MPGVLKKDVSGRGEEGLVVLATSVNNEAPQRTLVLDELQRQFLFEGGGEGEFNLL